MLFYRHKEIERARKREKKPITKIVVREFGIDEAKKGRRSIKRAQKINKFRTNVNFTWNEKNSIDK